VNQAQGPDRSALTGILLISAILGLWLIYFSPQPQPVEPVTPAAEQEEPEIRTPGDVPPAPTDSAFAAALTGDVRPVVVETDRYVATFSTRGGTPTSMRLKGFESAGGGPVELVQNGRGGALALLFNPPQGEIVDTRSLVFRPVTAGGPLRGDTLRVTDAPVSLAFDAPVDGGSLRLEYTFSPGDYEVALEVSARGTNVLAQSGGYELVWDGAIPPAESDSREEALNAGAYVHWGGETNRLILGEAGEAEPVTARGDVDWMAVKTKYFIAAIFPGDSVQTDGAELEGIRTGDPGESAFSEHFTARLAIDRPAPDAVHDFRLYLGPMDLRRLGPLGLYDTVEFGFGQTLTRPLARYAIAPAFAALKSFIPSYGLVVILFALIVKIVLWPFTATTFKNAARMRELQPQMEAVRERFADDPQKQQQEMMRVYKEAGVNPLAGCLPMLLQYPLLIALWRFFNSTLVLRRQDFLWAHDLSAPDAILQLPFAIPFYGDFVAGFTLLMGLSMIAQMKISAQPSGNTAQMKMMMYMLPAVFFLFFNRLPSGLSLYYLAFNVFSILQQWWVNRHTPKLQPAAVEVRGAARPRAGANGRAAKGKPAPAKKAK
jgi:YidC/Oxa1 family membrane protein insertase